MPNNFKDEYELAIEKGCYIERDCYSKLLDWIIEKHEIIMLCL